MRISAAALLTPITLLALALPLSGCGRAEIEEPERPPPSDESAAPEEPSSLELYREHPNVTRAIGAASRLMLEAPDELLLHSIVPATYRDFGYAGLVDPESLDKALTLLGSAEGVHGTLAIEAPDERALLAGGLYASLAHPGPSAGCYDPRHAYVATRGGERVVVFFCFACSYVVVLDATGSARYTTGAAQEALKAYLNDRLRSAGIAVDGE
ncbi:MAG: hypothetical protein ACYTG6_13095 [Planctomycetota bacterium]